MHASCTEANFFRESRIFCDFCKKERSILLCRDMTADHIKVVHCILSKLEDIAKILFPYPMISFPGRQPCIFCQRRALIQCTARDLTDAFTGDEKPVTDGLERESQNTKVQNHPFPTIRHILDIFGSIKASLLDERRLEYPFSPRLKRSPSSSISLSISCMGSIKSAGNLSFKASFSVTGALAISQKTFTLHRVRNSGS